MKQICRCKPQRQTSFLKPVQLSFFNSISLQDLIRGLLSGNPEPRPLCYATPLFYVLMSPVSPVLLKKNLSIMPNMFIIPSRPYQVLLFGLENNSQRVFQHESPKKYRMSLNWHFKY